MPDIYRHDEDDVIRIDTNPEGGEPFDLEDLPVLIPTGATIVVEPEVDA